MAGIMDRVCMVLVVLATVGVFQGASAAMRDFGKDLPVRGRHLAGEYCESCSSHCTHCSCGECSSCVHGYYLEHNKCKECDGCDHIHHCSWCECNTCKECTDGYELNDWGECEEVHSCDEHCHECYHGKCKSCHGGYYLQGHHCEKCGHCHESCHDCECGTCIGCGDESKYFLKEDGKCYECGEHYVLHEGECIEIEYIEEEDTDIVEFVEHPTANRHPRPHHPHPSAPHRGNGASVRASTHVSCRGSNCSSRASFSTGPHGESVSISSRSYSG